MRRLILILFAIPLATAGGCATDRTEGPQRGAKTLLSWEAGKKRGADDKPGEGGDGKDGEDGDKKAEEPEPIKTDRPDFTEASSTVGRGRVQLESGYTYIHDREDGVTRSTHSYPEALLRIGLFADWFELRLAQNVNSIRTRGRDGLAAADPDPAVGGSPPAPATPDTHGPQQLTGFTDLYIGTKLALTEQSGVLPESALIFQATVPSGRRDLSARKVLPGFNYLFSWEVIPDRISLGGGSQMNAAVDDDARSYLELAQSVTVGYTLTRRLGAYTEWFAFFPHGATSPGVSAQHFFDGGFTYLVTNDVQFDIRAGVGLSRRSDDYFLGTGLSLRY